LKVIGKISHSIPYTKNPLGYKGFECPIYDYLRERDYYKVLENLADHRVVLPTKANVKKAIDKMDVPFKCPKNKNFTLALEYFERMMAGPLTAAVGLSESTINGKASPGLTYKKYGIATKEEAIDTPMFAERLQNFAPPIFENCGKREFLKLMLILEDKIRTFKVSEVDFVMHQKFLFDGQNKSFMEACKQSKFWCRYGFSKEYGGFHRMCKKLEKFFFLYMSDISGWDRSLPVLQYIYNIRKKYLINPPEWFDWVAFHTVFSLECDQDGFVFVNHQGNRSGSNNTTPDNCLAHVLIKIYNLICIYEEIHGCVPDYDMISKQGVNLMGDDNLSGYTPEFYCVDFDERMRFRYGEFGLEVKVGSDRMAVIDKILPDFEFLGCTIGFNNEFKKYVPLPRQNKVASTIMYCEELCDLNIYAQRIIGLLYVSFADDILRPILYDIVGHLIKMPGLQDNLYEEFSFLLSCRKAQMTRVCGFE